MEKINDNLHIVVKQSNVKAALAYDMHNAARERFILISQMAINDDPFERDDALLKFYSLANKFMIARKQLEGTGLSEVEQSALKSSYASSNQGSFAQQKIVEMLSYVDEIPPEINKKITSVMQEQVYPAQANVARATEAIVKLQREKANMAVIEADESYEFTYRLMIIIAPVIVLISILVAWRVIHQASRIQSNLSDAKEDADIANRSKSDFLAVITHELRTPLTSLIGYNNLLKNTALTNDQHKLLSTATSAGKVLLSLINDVLDYSKIEEGKMEIESHPFRLSSIWNELDSLMRDSAEKKGLVLNCKHQDDLVISILGDQPRLQQVITNLLSNAIKFTSHGTVTFQGSILESDDTTISVLFEVIDTGIGMSIETIARLFIPFEQADSSISRRFGGTGLGLTISNNLVKTMGGKLIAHNVEGKGSTFCFVLSFVKCESQDIFLLEETEKERRAVPRLTGKVLIVEDTPEIQVLVQHIVSTTGAITTLAGNGQEAIDHVLSDTYDLVIMDMQMPIMNGMEATRSLRDAGENIPIVALTANAMGEHRQQMLTAGCNEVLSKPIEQDVLHQALSTYLQPSDGNVDNMPSDISADMMDLFNSEYAKNLDLISNASALNDFHALSKILHKIKGSAGSYGFPEISNLATLAEQQIETGDTLSLENTIDQLQRTPHE